MAAPIRSMTQGEDVGHYNVFRENFEGDARNVAWEDLPDDAKAWLKSKTGAIKDLSNEDLVKAIRAEKDRHAAHAENYGPIVHRKWLEQEGYPRLTSLMEERNNRMQQRRKSSLVQGWKIDDIKKIVESSSAATIDGMLVDGTTANAVSMVYDALSDENKTKVQGIPLERFVDFAWKHVSSKQAIDMGAWGAGLDAMLEAVKTAKTPDEAIAALGGHMPGSIGAAFWEGDGDELLGALHDAGWHTYRFDAPYYWVAQAPGGGLLSYTEGDIDKGDNAQVGEKLGAKTATGSATWEQMLDGHWELLSSPDRLILGYANANEGGDFRWGATLGGSTGQGWKEVGHAPTLEAAKAEAEDAAGVSKTAAGAEISRTRQSLAGQIEDALAAQNITDWTANYSGPGPATYTIRGNTYSPGEAAKMLGIPWGKESKLAGDSVEMATIPKCDICKVKDAAYDARLPGLGGSWGYVCEDDFAKYGPGRTGTGFAQRLVKASAHDDDKCAKCGLPADHPTHVSDGHGIPGVGAWHHFRTAAEAGELADLSSSEATELLRSGEIGAQEARAAGVDNETIWAILREQGKMGVHKMAEGQFTYWIHQDTPLGREIVGETVHDTYKDGDAGAFEALEYADPVGRTGTIRDRDGKIWAWERTDLGDFRLTGPTQHPLFGAEAGKGRTSPIDHDYVRTEVDPNVPGSGYISDGCKTCGWGIEEHQDWKDYSHGENGWTKAAAVIDDPTNEWFFRHASIEQLAAFFAEIEKEGGQLMGEGNPFDGGGTDNPYSADASNMAMDTMPDTPPETGSSPKTTRPRQTPSGGGDGSSVMQGFSSLAVCCTDPGCSARLMVPTEHLGLLTQLRFASHTWDIDFDREAVTAGSDEDNAMRLPWDRWMCPNCGMLMSVPDKRHMSADDCPNCKAIARRAHRAVTAAAAAGTGYYVIRGDAPVGGPWATPSEAYAHLAELHGAAVEFIEAGGQVRGEGQGQAFQNPSGYDYARPGAANGFTGGTMVGATYDAIDAGKGGNPNTQRRYSTKKVSRLARWRAVRKIHADVIHENPGLEPAEARAIAEEVVDTYPQIFQRG